MTVNELIEALETLRNKGYGECSVYADFVIDKDPMPPVNMVYQHDGYVLVTN